ncbi:NAD-dependent epimerase/dehydratase family protein [Occultella gossypii]|uniref:NAD-dependent epimerase/dehydratase family protein n=1 Tax=Occultella gossypii TaxID=2800820 RepID=A0ABS7SDA3_9MICO|nr:NAD-dependent epimerase/dehydratase family protein [Occultella gossypii]MBZ2198332.1 NAD-dependent epimerase/dehydratase family protein [Occultella gossypii]
MTTTALVTGASGFLGGYVVAELRRHGYRVIAAGRNAAALPSGGPTLVGDLDALAAADEPADVVIHCAGLSTPWGRWEDFAHANVTGTDRVLTYARRNGVRRVVHVSSPSIYAAGRDRIGITEDQVDPGNRLNSYIRSKIAAEDLVQRSRSRDGAPEVVIVRPRGLIGAGDPSLVPRLLDVHDRIGVPLFRDGRVLVDLTAVENVAEGLRLAAEAPGVDGEAFNLTNGDPRTLRALMDSLFAALGRTPRFRRLPVRPVYAAGAVLEAAFGVLPGRPEPPLTRYTVGTIAYSQTLDISKAGRMLGYRPRVTIDDALASYAG